MGSVFHKEPLHPCFNALLLYFKSSTVFFKCWNWQLHWPLATLNNPPFKSSSLNPDSVESCEGTHRGGLSAVLHRAEGEVMSGAPKIPEGRIQRSSYTASIMPVSQGGFTNWGGEKFTLVGFLLLVAPGSEPPQISLRQEASVSLLHSEASSSVPGFVVLTFLSKHRNKMSLFKEPVRVCREEVREGLQGKKRK